VKALQETVEARIRAQRVKFGVDLHPSQAGIVPPVAFFQPVKGLVALTKTGS